jgi:hypothetical protein
LIFTLFLTSTASAQSTDFSKLNTLSWKYTPFEDQGFLQQATNGATGVFVRTKAHPEDKIYVYSIDLPASPPESLEDWHKMAYPQQVPGESVTFTSESSHGKDFYQGLVRKTGIKGVTEFQVLLKLSGDSYYLFLAPQPDGLDSNNIRAVNSFYKSTMSKELR